MASFPPGFLIGSHWLVILNLLLVTIDNFTNERLIDDSLLNERLVDILTNERNVEILSNERFL